MRKLIFILFAFTAISLSAEAQTDTNVGVAISKKKNNCGTYTYTGYRYEYSDSRSKSDLAADAKRKVLDTYGGESAVKDANYNNENFLVIISSRTYKNGCERFTFGVGFGFSQNEALEDAIDNLTGNNWDWKKSDGYSVELSKQFF